MISKAIKLKQNLSSRCLLIVIVVTFIYWPNFSYLTQAEIVFTEIMYNPEGTDSGREWLEIYNSGSESVDLSAYKLLENNVNHKISSQNDGESTILESQKYAIIADNPEKFILDFEISGLILDSAFSLKNEGEEIQLINSSAQVVNSLLYSSDLGANSTGNTLQLAENLWIPAKPTPFKENEKIAADESSKDNSKDPSDTQENNNDNNNSSHSSQIELSNYQEKTPLKIGVGRSRLGVINSPIYFKATNNQENSRSIKYLWSFGDGDSEKGEKVKHSFYSPGIYNVVLNAKNNENLAVSRTQVTIKEPKIEANITTRGKLVDVMLINQSDFEVNLGDFFLVLRKDKEKQSFAFPQDTIINSFQSLKIASEITGFRLFEEINEEEQTVDIFPSGLSVLYPNKKKLFSVEFKVSPKLLNLKMSLEKVFSSNELAKFDNIFSKIQIDS